MILAEIGYNAEKHNAGIAAIKFTTISQVILDLVALYEKLYKVTASGINCGMCEDFAEDVCALVPGAEAFWDDELGDYDASCGSHKMIEYQGKYYDSNFPDGTENWTELLGGLCSEN